MRKKSSWIKFSRKQVLLTASPLLYLKREVVLVLPTAPESAKFTLFFHSWNLCRGVSSRNRQAIGVFYIASLEQFLNWNCAWKAYIPWLLLILYSVTLSKRNIINQVDTFWKRKYLKIFPTTMDKNAPLWEW